MSASSSGEQKVQVLEKELEKARTKIQALEKLYEIKAFETKVKELEILVEKQRNELDTLRQENTKLKTQNDRMQNQIERLSTLVYSGLPKSQNVDNKNKPPKLR